MGNTINDDAASQDAVHGKHIRPFVKPPIDFTSPQRQEGCVHSIPEVLDHNAAHNPSHLFCIQAKPDGSLVRITHGELKVAVSRCAAWLRENLPMAKAKDQRISSDMAPVGLLMPSDVELLIYDFALMSIQVPGQMLSLRLTPIAVHDLIEKSGACAVLVSPQFSDAADPRLATLAAAGIPAIVARPFESFLEAGVDASSVPAFAKARDLDGVATIEHSSGTTGLPKLIPKTHRRKLFNSKPARFDTEEHAQGLNLMPLLLHHGFSIAPVGMSLSVGKPLVFPPADDIANAAAIVKLITETKAKSMISVPSLLRDICNLPSEAGIKVLAGMDFLAFGGAPLDIEVGKRLTAAGAKLLNLYGTTELGMFSSIFVPDDTHDWRYFRLRPDFKHKVREVDPVGGERRFHLTVYSPGAGDEGFELPDQLVCSENHPETDFRAAGRGDTVIVLLTGLNLDPSMLENRLTESPMVRSALAFAETQFNLGVIVEPENPLEPGTEAAFREAVWLIVSDATRNVHDTARVASPDAIIIVPRGTAMPRTDKGTIARKEAYALFDKEIKAVYDRLQKAAANP